jgi:XTP/dITP diphosphohydrolase
MHTREEKVAAFGRLLDVMDALREKCPWNAEQTMESIRRLTEEEVYELSDAIMKGEPSAVCKEIGDLLYHMVFYARIGQESGAFDIADSLDKVCEKMIFRHPHVFGPDAGKEVSAKEIADTWELVKAKEKGGNKTVMEGIPDAMPALLKAVAMQEKARGCGFDWEKREDVWAKVSEELREVREACGAESGSGLQDHLRPRSVSGRGPQASAQREGCSEAEVLQATPGAAEQASQPLSEESAPGTAPQASQPEATPEQREEFGDLLFAVLNAARLYGVDPEAALSGACSKFRRRFNHVEAGIRAQGRTLADATLADMDALWDDAKAKGL